MKKYKKLIGLCICAALAFGLTACDNSQQKPKASQEPTTYSNLANKNSADEVKSLLSAQLDKVSVEDFFKRVNEYNDIAGATGLTGDFKEFATPQYDMDKISTLWREKKGDFIGTNCRINSYTLLKNNIEVYQPKSLRNDETIEKIRSLNPDIIIVVAYGKILPKEILEIPRYGCINVHRITSS